MFKNFSSYTLVGVSLTASLVLTACSGGSNKLPILDDEVLTGSAETGFVSVSSSSGAVAKKVKKLVIPAFNVTYRLKVEGAGTTVLMKDGKEITNTVDMKVNMENPDIDLMQRLTNKAYNVFVAELKNADYEVVSLNEVSSSEEYYQVNQKNVVTSASSEDGAVTLVPEGLKYYNPSDKMDPDGSFLMGVSNVNSAINGDLVEAFGGLKEGVASLTVNMAVQFGNFDLEDHRVSQFIPFNPSFTVLGDETSMEMTTDFRSVSMPGRVFYIPEESISYALHQDMGSKTSVIEGILNVSSNDGVEEFNATINEGGFERAGVAQIQRVSKLLAKSMMIR